ncbi:HET-domain-containing protein, partial [Setomelanomma holmii]
FRYSPLGAPQYTRLLRLEPGKDDNLIQCSVHDMNIDDPPTYTALSYTWGVPETRMKISVDQCDFLVTPNLWHALWHIRLKDDPLLIWIDAVCINQGDIIERNSVVRRMKDIYERADSIIAWLG